MISWSKDELRKIAGLKRLIAVVREAGACFR
jgi:hypothetical protein